MTITTTTTKPTKESLGKIYEALIADEEEHFQDWNNIIEKMGGIRFLGHHSDLPNFFAELLEKLGCTIIDDPEWEGSSDTGVIVFFPKEEKS